MKRIPFREFVVRLFAAAAILGGTTLAPNTEQSVAASEDFWSGDMRDRFYSYCSAELMRTRARLQPDAVHRVYCDCQVSEAEKWLQPFDMTFMLAAIDGESDAELEARALALPQSEAKASEKRMRQYTQSSYHTCGKAFRDAAEKIMHSQ